MSTTKFPDAIARLRQAVAPESESCPTDGQLVELFVADRDPQAFALLVRRHGPMVLSVCRRITGHSHDAEDAFQAVFLTFVRRAASVADAETIGNWLYGVAVRTARQARSNAAKRHARERPTDALPDTVRPDRELFPAADRAVLDDELARLPDRYRALIVLSDLEGEPQAALARRFGLPVGTVYSRLATARSLLAERLRKRGLVPAVVLAAAVPSPGLAAEAARLATTSACPSPHVTKLAEGVMRSLVGWNWKLGLITATLLVIAGGLLAGSSPEQPTAPPAVAAVQLVPTPFAIRAEPEPVPAPNKLLFSRAGHLVLSDPDGKNDKKVVKIDGDALLDSEDFRLSPDGKWIAVVAYADRPDRGDFTKKKILVRKLEKDEPWTDLGAGKFVFWSGDGTELLIADFSFDAQSMALKSSHHIVTLATQARTEVKLPEDHIVSDWSRDGKFFLTTRGATREEPGNTWLAPSVWVAKRDGTDPQAITDSKRTCVLGKISPDGKRVLFLEIGEKSRRNKLVVFDLAARKETPVEDIPANADLFAYCWGPDGKRIAYVWRKLPDMELRAEGEIESFLVVCDSDGKNAKTVVTEKTVEGRDALVGLDWR